LEQRPDDVRTSVDAELAALQGPASSDRYRELLASFPAGICVVTAFTPEGEPRGLTLIAFCGVSLDPPLVLVCVDRTSHTLPAIQASGGFTVNIISATSRHVARLMATKAEDKFTRLSWRRPEVAEAGPVLYEDAAAHILCRTWQALEAGDHWIFMGEVVGGEAEHDRPALVFHRRGFAELRGD
jgi:flavin reductase (DIM6/NTAB) family NADH-FMN oxidoreductase RutF